MSAVAAGLTPHEIDGLTIGEISIVIEGYNEREKANLISRINAICRALSKKGDPYKGLIDRGSRRVMSAGRAALDWIWQPKDE